MFSGMFDFINHLVTWRKERKKQQAFKIALAHDRPRFKVNLTKTECSPVPTFLLEILSLGILPRTVSEGEVFLTSENSPERVKTEKLTNREISTKAPLRIKFRLPHNVTNPSGSWETKIELVCQFSYEQDGIYKGQWEYNHRTEYFDRVEPDF